MPFIHFHTSDPDIARHPSVNLDGTWFLKLADGTFLITARHTNVGIGRHLLNQTVRDEMPADYPHFVHVMPTVRSGSAVEPKTVQSLSEHWGESIKPNATTVDVMSKVYELTADPIYCPEDIA